MWWRVRMGRAVRGGAGWRRESIERFVLCGLVVTVGCVCLADGAWAHPSEHPFEIVAGSFHAETSVEEVENGKVERVMVGQAGAHADLTLSFDLAHETGLNGGSFNDARTVIFELPPGLVGNQTATPTCTFGELVGNDAIGERGDPECKPATQVGTISFEGHLNGSKPGFEQVFLPIYNMQVTSYGVAAQFGFNVEGIIVQVSDASLRPGDSGITITSPNLERFGETRNVRITTWGVPASRVHDAERGLECFSHDTPVCENGGKKANVAEKPFLSNPTGCSEAHVVRMRADSWETPQDWSTAQTPLTPATEGCERVPFEPSIEGQPTTRAAETPSGLELSLLVPQAQAWEYPTGTASVLRLKFLC